MSDEPGTETRVGIKTEGRAGTAAIDASSMRQDAPLLDRLAGQDCGHSLQCMSAKIRDFGFRRAPIRGLSPR